MFQFILKRLGTVIPTFFGITLLTFTLIHMIPGDPIEIMAGERGISPERHAILSAELGLDQPIWKQYFSYVGGILQGDLGNSLVTKKPVVEEFFELFPATVELAFLAALFAICIGLPAGIIAAVKRGSVFDHTVMGVSLTGYSMPIFWWALLLMLVFSVNLGWTPVSGRIDVSLWIDHVTGFMLIDSLLSDEVGAFGSAIHHLILPSIVLGTIPLAVIARMTRSSMLEVLGEDYIRTARAKGLAPWRVIVIHALRNALIPVITVIGLQVGILLSGAILTETIFAWPGIGKWLIESIGRRDYPVVQGGILIIATLIILVNLLVDIIYGVVNPRIRHAK
ncbi:ABC transporter permease subunit [Moritella marina ATCC 15381]|uniref:ABC transporter permease subunit n=1 Tax=Moritella marina ATCC 15381 TaxID=1202962 RepID=A0A5J6WER4_MORMI|nr:MULTISPECIES: ABC transporter permease subunit [Moritella]QFI36339.1 ABC transporter permease subunit [Moritella marina ATCC 15381]GIC77309.1 peptide ABC transporter permease [Moritella sp. F1]GIC83163.1 peptide ABC transporter permease [Moritella sp. F3]